MEYELGSDDGSLEKIISDDEDIIDTLRNHLRECAQRYLDVADIIERDPKYDAVGFLRSSGERYQAYADGLSSEEYNLRSLAHWPPLPGAPK